METEINFKHAKPQSAEYMCGDRKWVYKDLPQHQLWLSSYYCSDGDGVELYIEKDGFELECFSGIPGSKIYIDEVDFGVFQCEPNKVDGLDFREPFEQSCIRIADYICGKFCEYKK